MKPLRVHYYTDELNDEFSGVTRKTITVGSDYRYEHNGFFWRLTSFLVYRILMTPIAYLYMKLKFRLKIVNRSVLKPYRGQGYLMYGNHTQLPGDGYLPTVVNFAQKVCVVVNADNISLKGTRTFMEMIGALVRPNHPSGMKNFVRAVRKRLSEGQTVMIYPEAHIWPYYTDIRPFKEDSFAFAGMFDVPVFSVTVTYQRRGARRLPVMTAYIDGPFKADASLGRQAAKKALRDQVYGAMKIRAGQSDYSYIQYVRGTGERD